MSTPTTTAPVQESGQKLLEDLLRFPNIFSQLTPEGDNNERLVARVEVTGYSGLVFLVMDLLKVSLLALEADPPYPSHDIRNPQSNVASIIELAIQLLPLEELELLDILHQYRLQNSEAIKTWQDGK